MKNGKSEFFTVFPIDSWKSTTHTKIFIAFNIKITNTLKKSYIYNITWYKYKNKMLQNNIMLLLLLLIV